LKTIEVAPPPTIQPKPLEDFLSKHGLVHGQWDLLLFGDGSGLSWDLSGGCAAILVDGRKGIRSHLVGAQSLTTVNRMELSAYVNALGYHFEFIMDGKIMEPPYRTFIFTDSEFTMKAGRGMCRIKKNRDLWQTVTWFELQGYRIQWRWVPRNSTPYNELADYMAGTANHAMKKSNISGDILHKLMPYSGQLVDDVELSFCPTCETPLEAPGADCPICGPAKG